MVAYIYAGSLAVAHAAAEVDWEMTRTGKDSWKTDNGEEVQYAYRAVALIGRPVGTRVYLAYGARERDEFHKVAEMIDSGFIHVAAEL